MLAFLSFVKAILKVQVDQDPRLVVPCLRQLRALQAQ
jgi:hypothetical protein